MEDAPAVATPNATTTAAAQTASNQQTAITQGELNDVNQVNPNGTSTYKQTGTNADGTPQMTQTTALSAPNQAIYDTGQQTAQNVANTAKSLSANAETTLATPFNADQAIASKIDSIGKTQLDPQWAANDAAQAATLANEGVTPGSAAYNNAMTSYTAGKNSSYNQLYLQGDAQAQSEALANRNSDVNTLGALMSGSQVATPTFSATPQTSVAGTDVAGITQNAYADENQQAQQSVAANNAMMGGLFGLAGTAATAGIKYSDRRLKTEVRRVGTGARGLPLYEYVIFGRREQGHMADEVERVCPEAVSVGAFGVKRVNYALLAAEVR
jgi:hypothetical protein